MEIWPFVQYWTLTRQFPKTLASTDVYSNFFLRIQIGLSKMGSEKPTSIN